MKGRASIETIVTFLTMTSRADADKNSIWGRRFFFVGLGIAGIASIFGLLHLLTIAIGKVREGKGFETYRTFWLVEFSYAGVLVLFAAVLVALIVAAAMWWREERSWRDFERKYGARDK